jgi:hypothetical protein
MTQSSLTTHDTETRLSQQLQLQWAKGRRESGQDLSFAGHELDWSSRPLLLLSLSQPLAGASSLGGDRQGLRCAKRATHTWGQPVREPILDPTMSANKFGVRECLRECMKLLTHILYC